MVRPETRRLGALTLNQGIVGFIGLWYALAALALLLVPGWFFITVGPFAPFNRHYEGDAGAFRSGTVKGMSGGSKPELVILP